MALLAVTAAIMSAKSGSVPGRAFSFEKKIGVVEIEGLIADSTEVVKRIHKLRDDEAIKAVVVRIDSPGGVVGPSQEIYAELKKLGEQKPVIVSMGAVAASGGYYVACPAKAIYANPGTITGSIGVVMELANLEGLFEWMKVKNVTIKSGKFKDIGSSLREMTAEEREILQAFVDDVHHQFETAVAEGRRLDPEVVHGIANGTIYTGAQAKELGLVDELGTLWDAIDRAAEEAGIEGEPKVAWPPEKKPKIFDLMNGWFRGMAAAPQGLAAPVKVMYMIQVGGN
jgi:protease-4